MGVTACSTQLIRADSASAAGRLRKPHATGRHAAAASQAEWAGMQAQISAPQQGQALARIHLKAGHWLHIGQSGPLRAHPQAIVLLHDSRRSTHFCGTARQSRVMRAQGGGPLKVTAWDCATAAHLQDAEAEILQQLALVRHDALVAADLQCPTTSPIECPGWLLLTQASLVLLHWQSHRVPQCALAGLTDLQTRVINTWSVGSQAWRQSRAALQSGSLTQAKICGPHFCTIRTTVPMSCDGSTGHGAR